MSPAKASLRLPVIAVVLTAILATVAAVAFASIPSADGTIDGCYEDDTGALRVIDDDGGTRCDTGETPIEWSQTGPAGPAGRPGVSGWQLVSKSKTVQSKSRKGTVVVSCPGDKVVLGGGYGVTPDTDDHLRKLLLGLSGPVSSGSGWTVTVLENPSTLVPWTLTVSAICANKT